MFPEKARKLRGMFIKNEREEDMKANKYLSIVLISLCFFLRFTSSALAEQPADLAVTDMLVNHLKCVLSYTVKNQGGPITANNPSMRVKVCDIYKCLGRVESLNDLVNPGSQKTFTWMSPSARIDNMGSPITLTIYPLGVSDQNISNNSLSKEFQCFKIEIDPIQPKVTPIPPIEPIRPPLQ